MKLLAVLALVAALAACSHPAPKLDVFGDIPQFELVAQNGQPFHSQVLAGKIWVADFIYTTCPGPCPRMTSQMREVQDAVSTLPDVRMVSFSIDPANDTPPVLAAYAKLHGASPSVWYFLTGPVPTLQMLDRDAFKLGNIDGTLEHSTRFVVVDRQGRIRGYYDTSEASAIQKVISDVRALAADRT
ncbi:MAG TPA: SCO family protein [Bryobacteraceae bacterium]|jgi:protein SCO1/2|nr:SCO family protein [Bryobacteraceae bacterium]